MKTLEITYTTDDPSRAYALAIRRAKNKVELIAAITPYEKVADDALRVAQAMHPDEFPKFRSDLKKAKDEQCEEWIDEFNANYGPIAMPIKLVVSSLIASKFNAPWGTAFLRCEQENWPMLKKHKRKAA